MEHFRTTASGEDYFLFSFNSRERFLSFFLFNYSFDLKSCLALVSAFLMIIKIRFVLLIVYLIRRLMESAILDISITYLTGNKECVMSCYSELLSERPIFADIYRGKCSRDHSNLSNFTNIKIQQNCTETQPSGQSPLKKTNKQKLY